MACFPLRSHNCGRNNNNKQMEVIPEGRWNIYGILLNYHRGKHFPRHLRHITKVLSQKNEQSFAYLYLQLILLDLSKLLPSSLSLSTSFPWICYLQFHRKYFHQTHAIQLVIALCLLRSGCHIFKSPQMKSTNVVCLKMPKNSVYKLKTLLKIEFRDHFSQDTPWVWLSNYNS